MLIGAGRRRRLTRYSEEEDGLGGEAQQQEVGHEEGGRLGRGRAQDAHDAGGVVHEQLHLIEEAACQEGGKEYGQHLHTSSLVNSCHYRKLTHFARRHTAATCASTVRLLKAQESTHHLCYTRLHCGLLPQVTLAFHSVKQPGHARVKMRFCKGFWRAYLEGEVLADDAKLHVALSRQALQALQKAQDVGHEREKQTQHQLRQDAR